MNKRVSMVKIKNKIRALKNITEADRKVLLVVDSFCGCPQNHIKAEMAKKLVKYAGCEAWKITMNEVYQ